MNIQHPVISCICVTRGQPEMLKRAIRCFAGQSYPHKELVVVYEDDDAATDSFLKTGGLSTARDIRLIRAPAVPKVSLGQLRNVGIAAASGEYVCQWDADDWYHMDRLNIQYERLREDGRDGIAMTQWIVFNAIDKKAYISNRREVWEGSILCRKSVLQQKPYEDKHLGEDTATMDYLISRDSIYFLEDVPGIYVYIYHGSNTWNFDHWNEIFEASSALSHRDSVRVAEVLEGKYGIDVESRMLDLVIEGQSLKQTESI